MIDKATVFFGRRPEVDDPIEELYQAIKLGKPYDELVRKLVMDRTGRIL